MTPSDQPQHKHTNRLAQETSPYLLQHQHNPVDWYPWGPEAFERARREDKPIFLSVGYSTCYWCHVMERQSFENEAVAAVMNQHFVNIKVDREERPDVDQLYMTAVQVLTRHGGWPMSVWLLPDLRPFYGGTYFPPTDAHGRPGFVTVLKALDDAYKNRRQDVTESAGQITDILQQLAEPPLPEKAIEVNEEWIDSLVARSTRDFDKVHGGFGGAPKFPRETLLELLLVHNDHYPNPSRQRMVLQTLDAMALGGIRDQLGGGFHRYSTDARWLVPHFEIMLYDNAMLAWCYVEAYRQTENAFYAEVARGVFDFVLREMTSPDGAFYTAMDAEVDAQEGLSYLWTAEEVEQVLGADDAKVFSRVYGLDQGPNFADPHHGTGRPDKNILYVAVPMESQRMNERLAEMRQRLKAVRDRRKQPLLDTKVITSWNALMIRALAYGGQVLQEQRYLDAAQRAADFLLRRQRTPDGRLYRASREGQAKYDGFLDDYAFLVKALIALRDAGAGDHWKEHAATVAMVMIEQFGDDAAGGFYFSARDAQDLIVRQKVASDSPLPSGNAVAAVALQALGQPQWARRTLALFAEQMRQQAEGMSSMVQAAVEYVRQHGTFTVSAAAPVAGVAAQRPPTPEEMAAGVVNVRAEWAGPTELTVHLDVLGGFHINANRAAKGLIATSVSVSGGEVEAIEYPVGAQRPLAFIEEPVALYEGAVQIPVRLRAPATGPPVSVSVTYQACDDSACLPPATKTVEVAPLSP